MMATGRKDFLDYSSGHEHERFGAIYQNALGMELLYGGGYRHCARLRSCNDLAKTMYPIGSMGKENGKVSE